MLSRKVIQSRFDNPNVVELHLAYKLGSEKNARKCPCKCTYCYNTTDSGYIQYQSNGQKPLSKSELKKLIKEWKSMGVTKAVCSGGYEFFSAKKQEEDAYASWAINELCDAGFEVFVYASGQILTNEDVSALLRCKEVRISLDSLDSSVYQRIRNASLSPVLRNMTELIKQRDESGSGLLISVSVFLVKDKVDETVRERYGHMLEYVWHEYNWLEEQPTIIDLGERLNNGRYCADAVIDCSRSSYYANKDKHRDEETRDWLGYWPGNVTEVFHEGLIDKLQEMGVDRLELKGDYTGKESIDMHSLAMISGKIHDMYGDEYKGMKIRYAATDDLNFNLSSALTQRTPPKCLSSFHKFVVGPFGDVYPCCVWAQPGYKRMRKEMGNIRESDSFQEFWLQSKPFRDKIRPGSCEFCTYYSKFFNAYGEEYKK